MPTRRRIGAATVVIALATSVLAASPAHAATQSLFGTTVDVFAPITSESLLGSTVYLPDVTPTLVVEIDDGQAADIDVTLLDGATTIDSCTILASGTHCGLSTLGSLPDGATAVTVRFEMASAATVTFSGTIFVVTVASPTFDIEWKDASGAWVLGSVTGLSFLGDIALRCLVTNNSNARITLESTEGFIELPGPDLTVPLSGTIEAGARAIYPLWSGSSSLGPTGSCSGGVTLRSGVGTGGGTGGAVIAMSGTITADRVPAPGTTVTITADSLVPDLVATYAVLLDGVPVPGSPVAAPAPDFDFTIEVDIPGSLSPGGHVLTVVTSYNGRDVALAAFPFEGAAPELAATGAEFYGPSAVWSGLAGLLVLAVGAGLLVASRRRRTA